MTASFSITTHFSPDDDTQNIFLDEVRKTESHLRIAVYGLHLPPLIDEIVALHQRGVDVALVCDHTQARGTYEKPEIIELLQAGVPLLEGTSDKHKIMHHKFFVRDKRVTLSGSWNFSLSASEESNYFDIIEDAARADRFLQIWQEMWDWVKVHEPQYQERV